MNDNIGSSRVKPEEMALIQNWRDILLGVKSGSMARLHVKKNGWSEVKANVSYASTPLRIGEKEFKHGLACHADSEIAVQLSMPARRFHAFVGVDQNLHTCAAEPKARVVFSVEANGKELWRSTALSVGMPPVEINLAFDQTQWLTLKAVAENGNICLAHTDWAEAHVELVDGRMFCLAESLQTKERILAVLPFSFCLGKQASAERISLAQAQITSGDWRAGQRIHTLAWRDEATGLGCDMELTEFSDFPALEWVIRICNGGHSETAPLSSFKALDISWKCSQEGEMPELRRSLGSDGRHDDFQYLRDDLRQSMWNAPRTVRMDSANNTAFRKARNGSPSFAMADGRPSATWLPFFNLRTGEDGLISALGWSGQWFAEFAHDGAGKTDISAGMEHLELKLQPGEAIRSPRILLLYWKGEPIHAHNVLRKFILKFHSPRVGGKLVKMPICNGSWGGTPTPGHLDTINAITTHGLPYDYYWIDAGWYGISSKPCPDVFHGEWGITGDWCVNRNYHPHGLKPISDAAHKAGMKFLLWVEPERAKHGTPVTLEHPEWFLRHTKEKPKPNDDLLLNLGHPAAWQWVVETVSTLIEENGIDCYREDFNIDPSPFWRNAEEEGRQGIVEMRFVEGLYAFWDELRRRHPKLLIDNCASGGRRLELETIGRSVALWRTDYNCFPFMNADASQVHGSGLNRWLPLNATSPLARPGDTYQVRSAFSAGLVLNIEEFGLSDCKAPDFPWDWFRKMIGEAKRLRSCFYGDFYPLTPCVIHSESWLAYQLLIPGKGAGAVLAFRRAESPMSSATFHLHDLQVKSKYELEDADNGKIWHVTGRHLMTKGLAISIDAPRASRLVFYKAWSTGKRGGRTRETSPA